MSCSSSEALFEPYLDHTLLPAQRAQLLAHLNGCGRCKGLLDELRVVDALIATPRQVNLPENFTFATMAEVRALPPPRTSSAPLYAYLVSYLVAAWLLIAAGCVLAPSTMHAFGETALDVSAQFAHTFGSVGHAGARVLGHFGAVGTLLIGAIAVDLVVAFALIVGFGMVRPLLLERLRS